LGEAAAQASAGVCPAPLISIKRARNFLGKNDFLQRGAMNFGNLTLPIGDWFFSAQHSSPWDGDRFVSGVLFVNINCLDVVTCI
jgi:hypothetical protein